MIVRCTLLLACALLVGLPRTALAQLTPLDRDELVDLHNAERCAVSPAAVSMPALAWNDLLAGVAQSHAQGCTFQHNSNRSVQYQAAGGSGYVGENIAWGTAGSYSPAELAQLWADEKSLWTYGPVMSDNVSDVGHYTQMIWADTTTIGCGTAPCSGQTFLVCNYAPGGNTLNQAPYEAGAGTNEACPEPERALGFAAALAALAALRAARR